jgi:hypothetical protein
MCQERSSVKAQGSAQGSIKAQNPLEPMSAHTELERSAEGDYIAEARESLKRPDPHAQQHLSSEQSDVGERYTPPWVSARPHVERPAFRAYRQFNEPSLRPMAGAQVRPRAQPTHFFPSEGIADKVARKLGEHKLLSVKELTESFEFFQRVRHRVSREVVADLCCGHGLVGMLFALLERKVERVILVDLNFPESSLKLEAALSELGPWLSPKLTRLERSVKGVGEALPKGAGVVAVHACGARTDWSVQAARVTGGPLAVMPCCYAQQTYRGPEAMRRHLGAGLSIDIERTYALERDGYQVSWQEVPPEVTPMNRVLSASPPRPSQRS